MLKNKRKVAMNIQIFGKSKCFDTKKAQRYFKERKIKFQMVDIGKFSMSAGELKSVLSAVGGIDKLVDEKNEDAAIIKYLSGNEAKFEKLLDNQNFLKTPIVRNGKRATVGYCPDVWKEWERDG